MKKKEIQARKVRLIEIQANLSNFLKNLEIALQKEREGQIERNYYYPYRWSEFYYYDIRSIAISLGNIIVKGTKFYNSFL